MRTRRSILGGLAFGLSACASHGMPPASELPAGFDADQEVTDPTSERFLQSMVIEEHLSGVALVMRRGCAIHARAYGPATLQDPNRLGTSFHVGSVTKQFTAAAIMHLVEQGAIELEGHINAYLPAKYRSEHWAPVRVRHLLSHTSGVPDYAETRDYYQVVDGWAFGATVDGMIREAMSKPLEFEPESRFYYSNIGFTLLGEIIQQRSGAAYGAFIQTALLDPIGMTQSRIHIEGHEARPGEAIGLRWNEDEARHTRDDVLSLPVTPPDGGLITTLSDFLKWIAVYRELSHPNVSALSLERMMQPSIPSGSYLWPQQGLRGVASYGFGLATSGDLIMHEGYIVGFRSFFIYSRNDDLLTVVFTNNTANDVFRIASGLFQIHG